VKRNALLSLFLALVIPAVVLQAQPSSGEFTYNFSGETHGVFDFSQSVTTNVNGVDETFTLELSPRGRLSGPFTAHIDDGTVVLDAVGRLGGRLISSPKTNGLVFTGRARLTGTANGRPLRGTQTFRASAGFDPLTGTATGRQTTTVCFTGRGCRTTSQDLTLDGGSDGSSTNGNWSLTLNTTNKGNAIIGTARATLANGRTVDFKIRGRSSPRDNTVQLTLLGTGNAVGVTLRLVTDSSLNLLSLRGKLFGQYIEFAALTAAAHP